MIRDRDNGLIGLNGAKWVYGKMEKFPGGIIKG